MRKNFGKIITAVLIGSMLMLSSCAGKAEASVDTPVSVTATSTVTEHRTEEIKETKKETSESTVSATDVSENVIDTAEISGNDSEAAASVSENDALETATEEETEKVNAGETADSDKSSAKSTTSSESSTETSTAKGNTGNNAGGNSSGSKGSNSASSTSTPASEPEPAPAPGPQVCQHTNTEDRVIGNTGRPIGNGQGCGQHGDIYHTFCKDCGADLGNERTVWGEIDHVYYSIAVYDTPTGAPLAHGTGSFSGHDHHQCYCGAMSYDDNYWTSANDHDFQPIQYYDADGNIWETRKCRYCPAEDGSDHIVQYASGD